MPISIDNNFTFLHIPKTAGTTLEEILFEHKKIDRNHRSFYGKISKADWFESTGLKVKHTTYLHHLNSMQIKQIVGDIVWEKLYKFTLVRNPWDRLVSLYFHHVKNFTNPYSVCYGKEPPKSFDDFLLKSKHLPPAMSFYITDNNNQIMVDYVGRFERLSESVAVIMRQIGIDDYSMGHHMKSDHNHYRDYYTDKTKDFVAKKYREDIARFNYDF